MEHRRRSGQGTLSLNPNEKRSKRVNSFPGIGPSLAKES
jgi:type IV secretory pathway TraG/TraD family ATPase VirD4